MSLHPSCVQRERSCDAIATYDSFLGDSGASNIQIIRQRRSGLEARTTINFLGFHFGRTSANEPKYFHQRIRFLFSLMHAMPLPHTYHAVNFGLIARRHSFTPLYSTNTFSSLLFLGRSFRHGVHCESPSSATELHPNIE